MTGSRRIEALFIFCVLICTVGCSSNLYIKAAPQTIIPQETKKEPLPGAIWVGENATNSLFSDRRARNLNDVVTIVVSESATGSNNGNTTTSRDTSTTAGITSALGFDQSLQTMLRQGATLTVGGTSSNSLKGVGSSERDGNLTATISARVMKIMGNGNFLIEGRKQVTINAEDQYLVITGIIRPDDIALDNTVLSQYIADAKLVYTGKGVVNDKMRPGWLTRIVDWAWPF